MRFKDKEEALRRLEAELLREEEEEARESENWEEDDWDEEETWDEEEESDDWEEAAEEEDPDEEEDWDESEEEPPTQRAPYRIYNADRVDADLDEYGEEVYSAGKRSHGRWIAAGALIALAAVLLVLAFLSAKYGGL